MAPHKTLLHDLAPPLASRSLLDTFEAIRFVEVLCRGQADEGPKMRFSEILFVHERHGRVEQSATGAAPAHAVVDDEPAQMGDTRRQVFPIDGKRSDNPPILDGEPDFVAGLLEAIAKFGEAPCDDGLEALTESARGVREANRLRSSSIAAR